MNILWLTEQSNERRNTRNSSLRQANGRVSIGKMALIGKNSSKASLDSNGERLLCRW